MQPLSSHPSARWPAPGATLAVGGGLQVVAVVPISHSMAWIEGVVAGAAVAGVVSCGADLLHATLVSVARSAPTVSAPLCLAEAVATGAAWRHHPPVTAAPGEPTVSTETEASSAAGGSAPSDVADAPVLTASPAADVAPLADQAAPATVDLEGSAATTPLDDQPGSSQMDAESAASVSGEGELQPRSLRVRVATAPMGPAAAQVEIVGDAQGDAPITDDAGRDVSPNTDSEMANTSGPSVRSATEPLSVLPGSGAGLTPANASISWTCTVWDRPAGRPLDLVLYEDTAERLVPEVAERVRRLGVPLIEALARLHGDGLVAGIALPAQVQLTDGGCRLLGVGLQCVDGPRLIMPGHGAPECVGRGAGTVDARTDVFFAGTVLHRLITGSGPYIEACELHLGLPAPQILRDELPAELCAVVRRACSPLPGRRYPDAVALLGALDAALATLERRRMAARARVWLDVGHELHIGVLKGHYAPINQDDVFLAYEPDEGVGLFLVTDGVSISTYGTGDQASTCVRLAAVDTWARLIKAGADAGMGKRPKLPLPGEPRRALLRSLLDQANAAIGKKVEASGHRFSGPPEGVMAATTVAVLVEDNHATLMSIGDSRIYLVRDGHIASLMVDHDLGTQLIRLGRSPTEARATPSSGALIRCVGEFDVNTDGTLRPVPMQPDFREMRLLPGDALLLCSDGLPDYGGYDLEHAEDRIREVMESAPGARWAAFELMVLANRGGGGDNISCIVLRVVAPEDGGAS